MYGYIYKSVNKINDHIYIGKKTSESFDPTYYGSGKQLKTELKDYGKDVYEVSMIKPADSKEELEKYEKQCIKECKEQYGFDCINRAEGGEGGNVHLHDTPEEHQKFIDKMTMINKMRCQSEEFKQAARIRMKKRYASLESRQKHSAKLRKSWEGEEIRKAQSNRLKEYYKTHKKDNSYLDKPCAMELNGEVLKFNSQKELKAHLKSEYNVEFPNPRFKQLLDSSEEFIPFHKNKSNLKKITGMKLYDLSEGVETIEKQ